MIGLTALISAITGLFSGSLPKIFDLISKRQDNKHELEIRKQERETLQLNHTLALERVKAEAAVKMDETYYQAVAEEAKASREQLVEMIKQSFAPSGVAWIDAMNAAVRPISAMVILGMFVIAVLSFMFGVSAVNADFAQSMAGLFSMSVEAVFGFIFGYRSALARPPAR